MRLLRARAAALGIDPRHIGVIGLSAGGNLAAITATRAEDRLYEPLDEADRGSARPDFAGLIYPVISLRPPLDGTRSRRELGTQKDAVEAYSAELHVGGNTPPTFLAQAVDDPIASVDHSLTMFAALRAHGVPAELHLFENGGHGWGLGQPGSLVSAWPRLFAAWARSHGSMGGAAPVNQVPREHEDN
jgi:acetyl esterase/lipase